MHSLIIGLGQERAWRVCQGLALLLLLGWNLSATRPCVATPLTPVVGLLPDPIDFGCIAPGDSLDVVAELFNDAGDPSSILEVIEITVHGRGFSLSHGPDLPIGIPGDSSTVEIVVRYSPDAEGSYQGTVQVVAPNAINSPRSVQLIGGTCESNAVPGRLTIFFAADAIPESAPLSGALRDYTFLYPRLREALSGVEIISLERMMPWFDRSSVNRVNQFGESITLHDMSTIYIARLSDPLRGPAHAIANLRNIPGIRFVEACNFGEVDFEPDDEHFELQWNLHNTGPGQFQYLGQVEDADVNALEAWNNSSGGEGTQGHPGVWVAVLDHPVDSLHVEFASRYPGQPPRVRKGPSFLSSPSDMWHGTAVAGIIGALGNNNGEGVAGVSWDISMVSIKTASNEGSSQHAWTEAIQWVTDQGYIDIMSLQSGSTLGSMLESTALDNAAVSGKLVVCSMGNLLEPYQWRFPQVWAASLSVGAVWLDGLRWDDERVPGAAPPFRASNIGHWIDVSAPGGRSIVTTEVGGGYMLPPDPPDPSDFFWGFGGTSAAAPAVAGVAALLKSYHGDLDGDDIRNTLIRTARDVQAHGVGHDDLTGWGIVRADAALSFVSYPRFVQHQQSTYLDDREQEWISVNFEQCNTPYGLPNGTYPCVRHKMHASFNLSPVVSPYFPVDTWFRTSGTTGWRRIEDNDTWNYIFDHHYYADVEWAVDPFYVVEGVTYVYDVRDPGNPNERLMWLPAEPNQARVAMTTIGRHYSLIGAPTMSNVNRSPRVTATPNPIGSSGRFLVDLPRSGVARLRLYDATGRLVRVLHDRWVVSGRHSFPWDGRNADGLSAATGVYFYALELDGAQVARSRVVLLH